MRIFKIPIHFHTSWWFILFLLSFSLASQYFPSFIQGLSYSSYAIMGISAALLLFLSVLFHELSHSLVARWFGLRVEGITLFFFGGVAQLPTEDVSPVAEFFMAAAGPLFSLLLAGSLYLLQLVVVIPPLHAIIDYLSKINLMLALFNMLPAYPLDGGRVFRSVLHAVLGDIVSATKIASFFGKLFGGFLFFGGIVSIFFGSFGGLWFVFLGGFLYLVAKGSYEQIIIKSLLQRVRLSDVLPALPRLDEKTPVGEAFSAYLREGHTMYIVTTAGKPSGILYVPSVPEYGRKKVKQYMVALSKIPVLSAHATAYDAFLCLSKGHSCCAVYVGKSLKGAVSMGTLTRLMDVMEHGGMRGRTR